MVDIDRLMPGSIVRIVDAFDEDDDYINSDGLMDIWCGKTMTIRNIHKAGFVYPITIDMEEDAAAGDLGGTGWSWLPKHIAEVLKYDPDEIEPGAVFETASEDDLASLLGLVSFYR